MVGHAPSYSLQKDLSITSMATPPDSRRTHVTRSLFQGVSTSSVMSGVHYQYLVAGLTAGVASTLVMHPFDLIKLRFAGELLPV